MSVNKPIVSLLRLAVCLLPVIASAGAPDLYEIGTDPGVGFNLVSWGNFGSGGASVWENAVQAVHDAGFDEVSLSPVRFYTPGVGSIATTSSQGPELSHVAAGVARAKSLGLRVTVNAFVEPVGFTGWRGAYNPTPGGAESNLFWSDYQQYLSDVAQMAETNGADSMTVGTELRAITRNSGNNANWNAVINAVDSAFSGAIGYAANWDNYNHPNLTAAIWEHPAVNFVGIDAYFRGLLNNSLADNSGVYPNATFIQQVEDAWSDKLDNEILPFAASLKSGDGLPVEFTEVGYLPYNRTINSPQNSGGAIDKDEQNMAFEGLMRALDGRRASGEFLATHVWQWDMPGSSGSLWNMNPLGGDRPNNQQTAAWLSSFVKGENPQDPSPSVVQVLYSFEDGLEGFYYPNFESEPPSVLEHASGVGATDGNHSLGINKPTPVWTWDARVEMSGDQLQALQAALDDNADDYELQLDVTYVEEELPVGLSRIDMHLAIQTDTDGWKQLFPFAVMNNAASQGFCVKVPLSSFGLSPGISSSNLHLGFSGSWSGDARVYIDRIALANTAVVAENPDFNGDGVVDAADYTVWRDTLGQTGVGLPADGNGDTVVDEADYQIWRSRFGESVSGSVHSESVSVPEPMGCVTSAWCVIVCGRCRFPRTSRSERCSTLRAQWVFLLLVIVGCCWQLLCKRPQAR